jgi:hypothetical protein
MTVLVLGENFLRRGALLALFRTVLGLFRAVLGLFRAVLGLFLPPFILSITFREGFQNADTAAEGARRGVIFVNSWALIFLFDKVNKKCRQSSFVYWPY